MRTTLPPSAVRRVRAAFVVAALWALLAAGVGLLFGVGMGVSRSPYPVFPDVGQWWFEWRDLVLRIVRAWAISGACVGLAFAAVFAAAERGRDVQRVSPARAVLWGTLGALGFSAVMVARLAAERRVGAVWSPGAFVVSLVLTAVFGAVSAWMTMALARGSRPRARSLGATSSGVVGAGNGDPAAAVGGGAVQPERTAHKRAPVVPAT